MVHVGLGAGLHASVRGDAVALLDTAGDVRFVLPAPFMEDATASSAGPASGAIPQASDFGHVAVTVANAPRGLTLTYTPDQAWLSAPGRAWPVVIDPSITDEATADCTLYQAQPTTSNPWCGYLGSGYDQFNWVGYDSSNDSARTLISFKGLTNAVPADAQVLGASLSIQVAGTGGAVPVWVVAMAPPDLHRASPTGTPTMEATRGRGKVPVGYNSTRQ